jgi:predicted RNA-binding Zn ribbon-like protein
LKQQAQVGTDGFLFLGNHLALDFLNTHPVLDGTSVELLPDYASLLRWFQAAGLLRESDVKRLRKRWTDSARARRTVEAVRQLRETLRKAVLTWEETGTVPTATVRELNGLMARHPMHTRLKLNETGLVPELWFEPCEPEDLFAPLAYNAATLFAHADRNRVRKCATCVGHFYDTSKKGTRRWCSMELCGNRAKVAAYAARQHQRPAAAHALEQSRKS